MAENVFTKSTKRTFKTLKTNKRFMMTLAENVCNGVKELESNLQEKHMNQTVFTHVEVVPNFVLK